ncbi:MAG: hypothetical protein JWQ81_924 [Amycolatopsis sp.]|uniref:hypothetical protein n=1 Tax=Amycolatopsis sp. TaxID=37632 RepID=UPI0026175707|nr:hypothetical protein [Amycolatopsis sp.]MCU1680185.1 hypothetical protein [Amycolatopsis sp.]
MDLTHLLRFGGNRHLSITVGQPTMLQPGAGRHRLCFPLNFDTRGTVPKGVVVGLTGHLWLGQYRTDWVGPWTTDKPVVTYDVPFQEQLVVSVSDEQLAVLEQRRADGDLNFSFDVNAIIGYDPSLPSGASADERWPAATVQAPVQMAREAWVRLLEQSSSGTSLAVVVPISLTRSVDSTMGSHLRGAIRKINNGDYADAVTEARKALDVLTESMPGAPTERALLSVKALDRTYSQRFALLKSAVQSFASPSAHGDQLAKTFQWDRVTASAAVSAIAALVACPLPDFPDPDDFSREPVERSTK